MAVSYADEIAFQTADPRRRTSDEIDFGATWRAAGSDVAWRLAWLRETGELYLCQAGGYPGPSEDVQVLAVIPAEHDVELVLDGWRDHRSHEDGLSWLRARITPTAA